MSYNFIGEKKKSSRVRTRGHGEALNATVIPPGIPNGNCRAGPGPERGRLQAREGERKGPGGRQCTSRKGPEELKGETIGKVRG